MFDKPEVFISYSREAAGDRPNPVADPDAFQAWRDRTVAAALLVTVERVLSDKNVYVWRDQRVMKAGDVLGHELDAALLSCAGAVILIDGAALERSSWVRWETSILTWRQRIGMSVRVVPVLIRIGVGALESAGYGPARVDDLLARCVETAEIDPDDPLFDSKIEELAVAIADDLGELPTDPEGPLAIWIAGIASCLPREDDWVPSARIALGDAGRRLALSTKPNLVMARELASSQQDRLAQLLVLLDNFPFQDAARLRRHLEPVWVPTEAVTKLPLITRAPPGERVIAVNALEAGTGSDVIRRAAPEVSTRQIHEWTLAAATPQDAADDCLETMRQKWGSTTPEDIVKIHGACYVVVSARAVPGPDLRNVVAKLTAAHGTVTYVVMVAPDAVTGFDRLEPDLDPGADDLAHSFELMLSAVVSS